MTSMIKLNADNYPIKSVTVFKSNQAEIVRVFDVSLQPGQSKIQISHLPASIDTESARVSGLGDAQLSDMVCSVGRGIEEIDPQSTSEVIRKLTVKKDALFNDRAALDGISTTMSRYSKTLVGESVSPDRAETFFENLLTQSQTLRTQRVELEEEILQLTRQIAVLSSAAEKKQGKSDGEVTVVIMVKQATEIELKLTYLVHNAAWSAAYELHAATEAGVPSPSVSFHYRARITQSTGEDWTDVALTLSTADMDLSTQRIPVLMPTKIRPPGKKNLFDVFPDNAQTQSRPLPLPVTSPVLRQAYPASFNGTLKPDCYVKPFCERPPKSGAFGQPPPFGDSQVPQPQQQGLFGQANSEFVALDHSAPAASFGSSARPPQAVVMHGPLRPSADDGWQAVDEDNTTYEEPTAPIAEPTTVVHESPLALAYRVEGPSCVPSDGVPHQLAVAVLPFSATVQHVAVPKARPVAYLNATVRNTSDYRLLTGPVLAFVDDTFAARTALPLDVAPGDTFHCTLGADPATRIRYARTSRRADASANATRAFSEQWASTEYTSRTTIINSHPFALRALLLRDAVPVSEDGERVNVVLRRPAGLADLKQGDELEVSAGADEAEEEEEEEGEEGDVKPERSKVRRTVRWSKPVDGKGGRKEGLFEWVVDVGAGEEVTIETEWDVKAPVSLKWIESL
ncbi:hypothetical protein EI94DRAFT_1833686 [Lactarius quietus]|nr:hypothetical protein EI94DRAFT_1833686 [Lactarius quietus]